MHPFIRIVCLIAFAAMLQLMQLPALAAACALLLIALAWRGASTFYILLRRSRWLLLSILLIYAYVTPGEYLSGLPDSLAPTYEGLQAGLMQMGRLAAMLAALSLLLASSTREDIMVGVYLMLRPLRPIGISPERFAARLWLTLHYVETMPPGVLRRLRQHGWCLQTALQEATGERPDSVQLQFPKFGLMDVLALIFLPPLFWVLT
jgi:energy-coupling factor transporter transmembrane protein EcfT